MRFLIAIWLLGFVCFPTYSQNKIDNLKSIIKNNVNEEIKLDAYLLLTDQLVMPDSAECEKYIRAGIKLAKRLQKNEEVLLLDLKRANILYERWQLDKTLEKCQSVLALNDRKDQEVNAAIFKLMGGAYHYKSQFDSAIAYFNKSLSALERLNEPIEIASTLNKLGKTYTSINEHNKAIEVYEKAITIYQKGNKTTLIANTKLKIAKNYAKLRQYDKAINLCKEQILFFKNNDQERANALFYQGLIYEDFFELHLAIEALSESLEIYQTLEDKSNIGLVALYLGRVYSFVSDYSSAIKYIKISYAAEKASNNLEGMAPTLNNLGQIHYFQGNLDIADSLLKQSLQLYDQIGLESGKVYPYYNLGRLQEKKGNYSKALAYFEKNYEIWENAHDSSYMWETLIIMGNLWLKMDSTDLAKNHFDQSVAICHSAGDSSFLYETYIRLGEAYQEKGSLADGMNYYFKSLEIAEALQQETYIAHSHSLIGDLYMNQDNFDKALDFQQKSLKAHKTGEEIDLIAATHNKISEIFYKTEQYRNAIESSYKALEIYKKLDKKCAFSSCHLNIGSSYAALNKRDSALFYLNEAKDQALHCLDNVTLASAYIALGHLRKAENNQVQVINYYEKAIKHATQSQKISIIKEASANLFPIYEQKKQYQKAFETMKIYQASKDSLFNAENTRNLVQQEMTYTFEKEKQQQQLLQQQKDLQQAQAIAEQRWLIYAIISVLLAMIIIAFAFYKNFRNKQKANILLRQKNDEIACKNTILKQQKSELEELDLAKSRFFANISHELRTPLTLISSPLTGLLSNTKERFSDSTTETLLLMQRSTGQLKSLVNNILDLSKLESKKLELNEEPFHFRSLINRVFFNFDSLAKHLNIQYINQISPKLADDWLMIDVDKLEKIINNLLSNAIKNTPAKGQVMLTAHKEDNFLIIGVHDTGLGITEKDLPHIFERFYQSKQCESSLQGGTGIGLALCRELTQLMEGELTVSSEARKGASFLLQLPLKAASTKHHEATDIATEEEKEEIVLSHLSFTVEDGEQTDFRVLIVEDHPDMQRFIASLLTQKYQTTVAVNGIEALNILDSGKHIDLIITDIMMPEMDGFTLIKKLKEPEQYQHIPVIMLTALGDEKNLLNALTIGVDDYLTKPFSPEELMARVHNALLRYEGRKEIKEDFDWPQNDYHHKQVDTTTVIEKQHTTEEWVRQVSDVIRVELENSQFNLSELANRFHLSERQFQRRIKKITGLSPKKLQQEIALDQARVYLENGTFNNITAISHSIGIKNVTRFNSLYEARFGKKPAEYFD